MSRKEGKTAKRYAKALFDLCLPDQAEAARSALISFEAAWNQQPELRSVLENPGIPEDQRMSALQGLAEAVCHGNATIRDFLCLLLSNGRLSEIGGITEAFARIINEFKKILSLEIVSAFELSESDKAEMQRIVRESIPVDYAAFISTQWTVEPGLIGGLMVRSGDLLLDASLRGALERMGKQLKGQY